jgi:diacylglycerol kinase (ATP)
LKQKIAFIINPKSGTDRVKAIESAITKVFVDTDIETEICYTNHAGHAIELSKQKSQQNFSVVVAVGGDGTVNEVATGLLNTGTALGIIPKGSGNGLARACNIPLNLQGALQVLKKGYIKTIDAGLVNNELFCSNTGVGLDAQVTKACLEQNSRGLIMYIKKSVSTFLSYKPLKYNIEIDGKAYQHKAIMVSVANGNEFGYGFKIAPSASLVDGKLDMMVIKPLNFFYAGIVSFYAWWGNLDKYSKVKHLLGRQIKITCAEMNCHQIDGDYKENNGELNISILPKSLNVIVP